MNIEKSKIKYPFWSKKKKGKIKDPFARIHNSLGERRLSLFRTLKRIINLTTKVYKLLTKKARQRVNSRTRTKSTKLTLN